jgi:hypothetical protein
MRSSIGYATVLCAIGVLFAVQTAHADQCAVVTKKQAELAKTYLGTAPGATSYGLFCEPCGDPKPKVGVVQSVSIKKAGKGYSVEVNGSALDLAYVYVDGAAAPVFGAKGSDAVNVGLAIGCSAQGVTKVINMGTAMWGSIVPNSTHPFVRLDGKTSDAALDLNALAGSWTVTTLVELSTCSNDIGGTKNTTTWTATAASSQLKIKSSSGGAFTGQVDTGSKSLVIWNDANRASSMTQLVVQDAKRLSGRQIATQPTNNKAEPACAVYRTVTATKAN